MKHITTLTAAAALLAISTTAFPTGGEQAPPYAKAQMPWTWGPNPCETGSTSWTCTIQCDVGSRDSVERTWGARSPGVELCRVTACSCQFTKMRWVVARPGFEVTDGGEGELVGVMWGLERLLGTWPEWRK